MKIQFYRTGKVKEAFETYWVIQKKKWWGWSTILYSKDTGSIRFIKEKIEAQGGIFI